MVEGSEGLWAEWGGHERTEEAGDVGHLDLELLFFGKVKEGFALGDDIGDEGVGDARLGNVEEADFEEGMAEGV